MKQPQQPRSDVARPTSHQPSHPSPRNLPGFRSLPFPSLLLPSLILLPLTLLLLPPQLIAQPVEPNQEVQMRQHRPTKVASQVPARHPFNEYRKAATRPRRQSRPREGLWQLYLRLMDEGSNDTDSAFSQIGQLFSTLIESGRPRENIESVVVNTTEAGGGGGGENSVDGGGAVGNATTTTTEAPPRKISTGELMGIFRRNVFGLGRLFGREFWNAIQQSNKNIEMYSKEWNNVLRPYIE